MSKIEIKRQINPQESESVKGRFKLLKGIIINLINAFSHTMLITTVFFIGYILFIYFDLLWILELLLKAYFIFMLIVFIVFTIIKYRSLENDIVKTYYLIIE